MHAVFICFFPKDWTNVSSVKGGYVLSITNVVFRKHGMQRLGNVFGDFFRYDLRYNTLKLGCACTCCPPDQTCSLGFHQCSMNLQPRSWLQCNARQVSLFLSLLLFPSFSFSFSLSLSFCVSLSSWRFISAMLRKALDTALNKCMACKTCRALKDPELAPLYKREERRSGEIR